MQPWLGNGYTLAGKYAGLYMYVCSTIHSTCGIFTHHHHHHSIKIQIVSISVSYWGINGDGVWVLSFPHSASSGPECPCLNPCCQCDSTPYASAEEEKKGWSGAHPRWERTRWVCDRPEGGTGYYANVPVSFTPDTCVDVNVYRIWDHGRV